MEASFTQGANRTVRRMSLSGLGKLTAGALAGVAALLGYLQVGLLGGFDPMMSGIAAASASCSSLWLPSASDRTA